MPQRTPALFLRFFATSFSLTSSLSIGRPTFTVAERTRLHMTSPWIPNDSNQAQEARDRLNIWPLDEQNAALLNEVHPRDYVSSADQPHVRSCESEWKFRCVWAIASIHRH